MSNDNRNVVCIKIQLIFIFIIIIKFNNFLLTLFFPNVYYDCDFINTSKFFVNVLSSPLKFILEMTSQVQISLDCLLCLLYCSVCICGFMDMVIPVDLGIWVWVCTGCKSTHHNLYLSIHTWKPVGFTIPMTYPMWECQAASQLRLFPTAINTSHEL